MTEYTLQHSDCRIIFPCLRPILSPDAEMVGYKIIEISMQEVNDQKLYWLENHDNKNVMKEAVKLKYYQYQYLRYSHTLNMSLDAL